MAVGNGLTFGLVLLIAGSFRLLELWLESRLARSGSEPTRRARPFPSASPMGRCRARDRVTPGVFGV